MGRISLIEGYNIFEPYIDTEFGENYTPEKFELINKEFTEEEVLKTVGKPLFIHRDTLTGEIELTYTNDGFLRRKSNRNYDIEDFAWYRSSVHFDSIGKIIRIDKGWSYD
ncbi:hypothetical protein ASG01_00735 [Chryseobacterium sp. Leaf180]|nr:hypothetical protein ASG01_00735 [Chryseobacterium sp. Leaf180]